MLWHYNLQEEVMDLAHQIQLTDYFDTHSEVVTMQRRGRNVSYDKVCPACSRSLVTSDNMPHNGLTIFNCGHTYHEACVTDNRCSECLDWSSILDESKATVNRSSLPTKNS